MFELLTFNHDELDYEYSDDSEKKSEPFQRTEQHQDEKYYVHNIQQESNQVL
jgi:hypothetical protein